MACIYETRSNSRFGADLVIFVTEIKSRITFELLLLLARLSLNVGGCVLEDM
jgi:hypothetical protein